MAHRQTPCYRDHRMTNVSGKILTATERRLICERCGQEFGCARDNIAECWCNAEAYQLPLPAAGARTADCLCPACLRQAAARLQASPDRAGQG
jgi:Cysteine-rich CWC